MQLTTLEKKLLGVFEKHHVMDDLEPKRRVPQWIYLAPIALAPVAHWLVTAAAQHRRVARPLLLACVGFTAAAVANRLVLMGHAGYPGSEGDKSRAC